MIYFRGFSTAGSSLRRKWALYDLDLVKQDLSNAFQTRRGARIGRPDYGCAIWDYFMEPLTPTNQAAIVAEATRICELDPRLLVQNVSVTPLDLGVQVSLTLLFQPWNVLDSFTVNFENRQTTYYGE